jgi:hypothetical protein
MEPAMQETFLVERYWPGATRVEVTTANQRLLQVADDLAQDGASVRIMSSIWVPADEVLLTLCAAGEADDVRAVNRRSEYPFDRVQRIEVLTRTSQRWRGDDEQV